MERYGEKPKKFTRSWFEYVWEYYKIHIIAVILIVIAIVYTWASIAGRTFYDLNVCFYTDTMITQGSKEKLTDRLKEIADDVNNDNKINVMVSDYSISGGFDDKEYVNAVETKFYLEVQVEDTYLYIVSKDTAELLKDNEAAEGVFESVAAWSGKESEYEYFINIKDSDILKESGITSDNLYIGIRNFVRGKNGSKNQLKRENAIKAAKIILGE